MAITQTAMTFGEGLRATADGGVCRSRGYTEIGTHANFQGPKFFIMFRFKLRSLSSASATMYVGTTTNLGGTTRFYIDVYHNPALDRFEIGLNLNCNGAAYISLGYYLVAEDLLEHSVAWMYDQNGTWAYYFDGVLTDSGTSPACDVSGGASTDRFMVIPSNIPGIEKFDLDEVVFSNSTVNAAAVLTLHQNGAS